MHTVLYISDKAAVNPPYISPVVLVWLREPLLQASLTTSTQTCVHVSIHTWASSHSQHMFEDISRSTFLQVRVKKNHFPVLWYCFMTAYWSHSWKLLLQHMWKWNILHLFTRSLSIRHGEIWHTEKTIKLVINQCTRRPLPVYKSRVCTQMFGFRLTGGFIAINLD